MIHRVSSQVKEADLSDPTDPLSHSQLRSFLRLQNDPSRTYSSVFNRPLGILTSYSPEGRTISQKINPEGLVTSVQNGSLFPVSLTYDNRGRIASLQQQERVTQINYDGNGNLTKVIDAAGRVSKFRYDEANRVIEQILPDNFSIFRAYDKNGDLVALSPPGRPAHCFTYDLMQLASAYLPPALSSAVTGATQYSYNLDRQLTQINRPDGQNIRFVYGVSSGLAQQIQTPSGNYDFSYFPNKDLVATLSSPDGEVLKYKYLGAIRSEVENQGQIPSALKFEFNVEGTISKLGVGAHAAALDFIDIRYDKDSLLSGIGALSMLRSEFGAIKETTIGKLRQQIFFNAYGEMIKDSHKTLLKNNELFELNFKRDRLGRITKISERFDRDQERAQFTYDAQGRLSEVLEKGKRRRIYKYDANGNRIEKKGPGGSLRAVYDLQDRLLSYGKTEYKYNANGDLLEKIEKETDRDDWDCRPGKDRKDFQKTKYLYDVFGNLQVAELPNRNRIEYIIDGQNRRIGKKINGRLVQGFIYQSQTQIAAELDGSGQILKRFVYGSKINVPDYMVMGTKKYRIISDQVGTPRLVVDTETGKIIESLEFDEFGIPDKKSKKSILPFGFAGGLYDKDTELFRFGARDYDPVVGRWVSKDPIGFKGALGNLYSYVGSEPINRFDPSGLLLKFSDASSHLLFAQTYASSSPALRNFLDNIARDPDVTVTLLTDKSLINMGYDGEAYGNSKDITISLNPNTTSDPANSYNQSLLIHEFGHVGQLLSGQGGLLDESFANDYQNAFRDSLGNIRQCP